MKSEYHLFIIWQNALSREKSIVKDIANTFEILYRIRVTWSKEHFSRNLTRFYGVSLPKNSGKEQHIGTGSFLVIVVKDHESEYNHHDTSKGVKLINSRTFTAKTRYREITGGGHKIHGTNTPAEFSHDFALLFGESVDDFMKVHKPSSDKEIAYSKDLVGYKGWDSLSQMFAVLNLTEEYVVMRNYEPLPRKYYADKHGDIDFLVQDYESAKYVLNAEPVFDEPHRVHHRIVVNNDEVLIDLRHVGDGYYDKKWQKQILKEKTMYRGVFVMSQKDHLFSLLYHAIIHKPSVASDYIQQIKKLNQETASFPETVTSKWFSDGRAHARLGEYLARSGYEVTRPESSVFFNEQNKKQVEVEIAEEGKRQAVKQLFDFDVVVSLSTGLHNDARRYYKATKGKNAYFVKSGVHSHKIEYEFLEKTYQKNQKNFLKPIMFRDGDVNYLVVGWADGSTSLEDCLNGGELTPERKKSFARDMYEILNTLRSLNIVHRDIIPRNLMVVNEHLVLIDFYWAVDFQNYMEYEYIRKDMWTINYLGENHAAGVFRWDDAFSLESIAKDMLGVDYTNDRYIQKITSFINDRVITPSCLVLSATIAAQAATIKDLQSANAALQAENNSLKPASVALPAVQSANAALRAENSDLHAANAALRGSISWRTTAPLRKASKGYKILKKKAKR
ncbi:hypothetical protein CR973_01070 [Candidatus Saccharibacteria bacterium]|nr:MAG: hypothetical protein CR973_01070 [Candidatus Saccharibacteria bacterium]